MWCADFSGMFISFIVWIMFIAALAANILLIILKLCGVLLLSWWWLVGFIPAVCIVGLIIAIFCAGVLALFD